MVYDFDQDDMVKGSGYVTFQCCGFTEIELGTVYAAEIAVEFQYNSETWCDDAEGKRFRYETYAKRFFERFKEVA